MSTQHPDHVNPPFFAENSVLAGDDEIKEAFYAFSHLGCREQLWDFEGKEVDSFVVKKLLSRYESFFKKNVLGKEVFLTPRVPNPEVEKADAKILLETLESIPRSFDTARLFYGEDIAPIFEVFMPMTTHAKTLIRTAEYYKQWVVGKQDSSLIKDDIAIKQWIGSFLPEKLGIIPLYEDRPSILNAAAITEEYLATQGEKDYQRVWLARSDPALNYSSLGAELMIKISLQRLQELAEKLSLPILPVLGCGSAPFRGNFKPTNAKEIMEEYPSVHTFTIQSAFKYDYPEKEIAAAIDHLNTTSPHEATPVDEQKLLPIIDKVAAAYQDQVTLLAPLINDFSAFIPQRRKRKLHIGLFGYSRSHKGVQLPRAIPFCSALESLGLPPQLLGLHVLTEQELDAVVAVSPYFEKHLDDSLQFLNADNLDFFPQQIGAAVRSFVSKRSFETERKHKKITSIILEDYKKRHMAAIPENVVRAASIRGYLG